MADDRGYDVQKAEAKEDKDGNLHTHNYFGDHSLGSDEDTGEERHGHVIADESGNVEAERDVGEEGMTRH